MRQQISHLLHYMRYYMLCYTLHHPPHHIVGILMYIGYNIEYELVEYIVCNRIRYYTVYNVAPPSAYPQWGGGTTTTISRPLGWEGIHILSHTIVYQHNLKGGGGGQLSKHSFIILVHLIYILYYILWCTLHHHPPPPYSRNSNAYCLYCRK